jgi:formate transporter
MESPEIPLFNNPVQTTQNLADVGIKKGNTSAWKLLLLGLMGGAFIAFASEGSNAAIHTIPSIGLAKALAGALFSTGLMLVVLFGAELFTGNMLMVIALFRKDITLAKLLRNWALVYIGNFAGSVLIAVLIAASGQLDFTAGMLGAFTLKTAVYKVNLTFLKAFSMGILCNWLVCMGVWMAANSKDATGKILGIFFPIWLFITSGFEHSVANMYYIPAGLFIKSNPTYVQGALDLGISAAALDNLTWTGFLVDNLIPVTLGNIVGGGLFVGTVAFLSFGMASRSRKS